MATRFGGCSPAHAYAAKVRWLVGCLLSLVAVLSAALISFTSSSPSAASEPQAAVIPAMLPDRVEVLIPTVRIEAGAPLGRASFAVEGRPRSLLPVDTFLARDRQELDTLYASRMLSPGTPLLRADTTDRDAARELMIPAGFRAQTILVDNREGVDWFAVPSSRVDVLWTFQHRNESKVITLVRFAKVLSVGGDTEGEMRRASGGGTQPVTLLVTEKDAKRIELARTAGKLSLSLLGNVEDRPSEPEAPLSFRQLFQEDADPRPAEEEIHDDGVAYVPDTATGKLRRYVLRGRRWSLDSQG